MSINYKSIDSLLKKINKPKRTIGYLNIIHQCLNTLISYSKIIEKEFPNSKGFIGELKTHIARKHHIPREEVLRRWSDTIENYFTYLIENKQELEELINYI